MAHESFEVGDLVAVIGDNAEHGAHRSGYNGLWSLKHQTASRSLFVPAYAGLNHEHIFGGEPAPEREVFFEPRFAPMTLTRLSETACELHQPPTPTFHLESWTRFEFQAPHSIDMTYRCVAHQHVFPHGYIGLFWASYINAPDDKSIYFPGGLNGQQEMWTQYCTQFHNDQSTVRHRHDSLDLTFDADHGETLFKNISRLRFDLPLYYGLFDELIWIVMFDPPHGIRFSHSPSGGGANLERNTTNPAWDFQFIIPNYEVRQPYEFKLRAVFRPRCSRDDVLEEYRRWKAAV